MIIDNLLEQVAVELGVELADNVCSFAFVLHFETERFTLKTKIYMSKNLNKPPNRSMTQNCMLADGEYLKRQYPLKDGTKRTILVAHWGEKREKSSNKTTIGSPDS